MSYPYTRNHNYIIHPKNSAVSTKEATAKGHKVTTVAKGAVATAAAPAEPVSDTEITTMRTELEDETDELLVSLKEPSLYELPDEEGFRCASNHFSGRLIPIFWSGFWIEAPGTERAWREELKQVCSMSVASKNIERLRQKVHGTEAQVCKAFGSRCDKGAYTSGRSQFGKVELLELAAHIRGIALQVNVQLELDPKLAPQRDRLWSPISQGGFVLPPTSAYGKPPSATREKYDKFLESCQNSVGTLMSETYATQVLQDYASSRGETNSAVFVMRANEYTGFKEGATKTTIARNLRKKFFTKAELPVIVRHAKDFPGFILYVIVVFNNQEDADKYRSCACVAVKEVLGQDNLNIEVFVGHGKLENVAKREEKNKQTLVPFYPKYKCEEGADCTLSEEEGEKKAIKGAEEKKERKESEWDSQAKKEMRLMFDASERKNNEITRPMFFGRGSGGGCSRRRRTGGRVRRRMTIRRGKRKLVASKKKRRGRQRKKGRSRRKN